LKSQSSNLKFHLPGVYPITDERISSLSHFEQVKRLISGGAEIIQLREKFGSPREFYESAVKSLEIARAHGCKIIINDRVDIALAAGADGVHLGQDDLPPEKARGILGPHAIIGFSTHSAGRAIHAMSLPIDYIAIGPIFTTCSKESPDEVVGLEGLKAVRSHVGDFALVAIGGINADNLLAVLQAGAGSAAMIGAIISDPAMIEERLRHLIRIGARPSKAWPAS